MSTVAARPLDWDAWRAGYDDMSFADQQDFYDRVFDLCRVQQQHDAIRLSRLLAYVDRCGWAYTVGELGGWDGELAAAMLHDHPTIGGWVNYEISRKAADASVCQDPRYKAFALDRFYWETPHLEDVFVASHVLEHLRFADVQAVFDHTTARWLYLAVPVTENGRDWDGYHGSHILEVGWHDLARELDARGYDCLWYLSNAGIRCFERRP